MSIVFSEHVKEQLKRRKISQVKIIQVVRKPQDVITSYRRRKLRRVQNGGKILQLVTITEGSKIIIISGYYIKK
jgi:hypothetical protein